MSDGSLTDPDNTRVKNGLRRTQIFWCIFSAVVLFAYFLGGKALIETARTAQQNKKMRLEFEETNRRVESDSQRAAIQLGKIGEAMEQTTNLRNQDMLEIQPRLSQIERQLREMLDVIDPLLNLAQEQEMTNAREKADIGAAYVLGGYIKGSVDQLQNEFEQWESRRQEILTSQIGYRIAANPDLVERFQVLIGSTQVNQEQLDVYKVRLKEILVALENAHNNQKPNLSINQEDLSYLNSIGDPIKKRISELNSNRLALEQITLEAEKNQPSQNNLGQAIKKLNRKQAVDLAAMQIARVQEIRKKSVEKRAQLLADAQDELTDSIAKKQAAEDVLKSEKTNIETLEIVSHTDEFRRRREEQQLKQDFQRDLPEIKSLLTPFITEGQAQPMFPSNGKLRQVVAYTGPFKLVSWTKIQGAQMLDPDDEDSLERLFYFAGYSYNYRKKGGFPTYVEVALKRNPVVQRKVKRAQELLIKYGDLMVDRGLLLK